MRTRVPTGSIILMLMMLIDLVMMMNRKKMKTKMISRASSS